jgi:hypothetical protein
LPYISGLSVARTWSADKKRLAEASLKKEREGGTQAMALEIKPGQCAREMGARQQICQYRSRCSRKKQ